MTPLTPTRLRPWTAVAMASPAIVAASWLTWVEITRDPPHAKPDTGSTLSSAIQDDDIVRAFAHIRSGEDPNAPVAYRHERLTGGREIMVTPLVAAIAHSRDDSVKMLMSSGARLDVPGSRFAVCLAKRLGHDRIVATLVRYGGAAATEAPCPEQVPSAEAPLEAYVD
jgi:hypothetical protein